MKKIIAWPLAWSLYWAGDITSKPLLYFNWWWLYPIYNQLMCASFSLQDWSKINGPWESTKK